MSLATTAPLGPVTDTPQWSVLAASIVSTGLMLRMFSVPPSAIGFPSSPVTLMLTAALAAAGAMAAAAIAAVAANRALRLLRCDVKRVSLCLECCASVVPEHSMVTQVAPGALTGAKMRTRAGLDE